MEKELLDIKARIGKTYSFLEYHTDELMKATSSNSEATRFSLLRGVVIENPTDQDFENLTLTVDFSLPELTFKPLPLGKIEARSRLETTKDISVNMDASWLYHLAEPVNVQASFSVVDKTTGKALATLVNTFRVVPMRRLSPTNPLLPFVLSKFVTPERRAFDNLLRRALGYHQDKPFVGYEDKDPNAVLDAVNALYKALHDECLEDTTPANFSAVYSRIQLPEETLRAKSGSVLDFSLLMASLMETAGLHPILILADNTVSVGCFLSKADFFDYIEKSSAVIYNKASRGIQSLVLLDAASLKEESSISFQKAMDNAREMLRGYRGNDFNAIDILTCHQGYFKPIPFADETGSIDFSVKPLSIRDEKYEAIVNEDFIDIERNEEKDRFTTWERKLLDLSEENRLVSFRFSKDHSNAMRLMCPNGRSLYDFLRKNDDKSFTLTLMSPELSDGLDASVNDIKQKSGSLMAEENTIIGLSTDRLLRRLLRVSRDAQEETGASTLYLVLGLLTYAKEGHRDTAPFLLLPISIARNRLGKDYTVSLDMDQMMVNQTFFEYYKLVTGNDYSSFYGINVQDDYKDIVSTFKSKQGGDITLDEDISFVANFTFSHYVMWKDIHERKEELKKNTIVASLLANQSQVEKGSDDGKTADEQDAMQTFAAPLPYDSTQLQAILACGRGESFILDGPPGTGKSQTIVNMIINAFYQGKTVLFVAEKMAALSVVKDRLDELGLGRFALELYSSKATKANVFAQLGKSLEQGKIKDSGDFEKICRSIEEQKDKLGRDLEILHRKGNCRYSLYEAILLDEQTENYRHRLSLDKEFAKTFDDAKDERIQKLLREIHQQSAEMKDFDTNPFKVFALENISYFDKDKFVRDAMTLDNDLAGLEARKAGLVAPLCPDETLSREEISKLMTILPLVYDNRIQGEMLLHPEMFEAFRKNCDTLAGLCHYGEVKAKYEQDYDWEKLLALNTAQVRTRKQESTSFLRRIGYHGYLKKTFAPILRNDAKVDYAKAEALLDDVDSMKELRETIRQNSEQLNAFFHEDILADSEKASQYLDRYLATEKVLSTAMHLDLETVDAPDLLIALRHLAGGDEEALKARMNFQGFKAAYEKFLPEEQAFEKTYAYRSAMVGKKDFFQEEKAILDAVSDPDRFDELLVMTRINQAGGKLKEEGLEALYQGLIDASFTIDDIDDVYLSAVSNSIIAQEFTRPEVNGFSGADMEATLDGFRQKIHDYDNAVITSTANRLTRNFVNNSVDYQASTPIGALKKLVSTSGRGITIRNALNKYGDYFRTYFPCFMMSPLSSAQYLSVDSPKFDIVIFDEASQIPTSEAIGPIARGNALIVSGDPKQMPPTNFFDMNTEGGEEEHDESLLDAESLLDDCLSVELPRYRLSYHYRSRHESLIAFSNHSFYDSGLYTFPSFDSTHSHVTFQYIEPKQEKKASEITADEIDAILERVIQILEDPTKEKKTIGVIVFNTRQQDKLNDAFDDLFDKNPVLKAKADALPKPIFVKSLENVQGDERDIILLSIGFRKNAEGKATIQGPITLDKGERRLNVAVTRAKDQMIVLSTIRANDIQADNARHQGPRYLKAFLAFAQKGEGEKGLLGPSLMDDQLILRLKADLKDRGYEADSNIGTSEFRLPLAVRSKDGNSYVLGILLDKTPSNPNVSLRDRTYVQRNMLLSLGWHLIDIYVLDFYRFEKKTVDRIVEAIQQAGKTENPNLSESPNPVMESDNTRFDYGIEKYRAYKPSIQMNDFRSLDRDTLYPVIVRELETCVHLEQPVSYETIRERMRRFFGLTKYSAKTDSILRFNLEHAAVQVTHDYQDKAFYWDKDNLGHAVSHFRSSDRRAEDIAKEEIVALLIKVIEAQGTLSREDLIRATGRLMGFSVVSDNLRQRLSHAIDFAIGSEKIPQGVIQG